MALKAAPAKAASGQRALASSSISSLRVKPFVASRSSVRARAAAVDEEIDFAFSFTDAKRNNQYTAAEVEAAIRYYETGEGLSPVFDADFVSNAFGVEDASFFDDIDNEEAYSDEYIVAGIPEAAPKKRGRGRNQAGQDEEDQVEQAKALDRLRALEDRMLLEAAMEEQYGNASGALEDQTDVDVSKPGVWDWLTDFETPTDAEELKELTTSRPARAGLLTDSQVASDIAFARPEVLEDPEIQTYLDLFANDDLSDEVLATLPEQADLDFNVPSSITDDDLSRLDAMIDEEIPQVDLESPEGSAAVPRLEDFQELDKAVVDQYINSLRAVISSNAGASEAEVKALFGDAPLSVEQPDAVEDAASLKEYNQLLAHPEPKIEAVDISFDAEASAIEDTADEPDEEDETGLERELRALAAIEEFREEDLPSPEVLDGLEGYLVSAEDYIAKEDARKAAIAAAIARGEMSPDALAEDLEELPDAVDELVDDMVLAADEDVVDMSGVEEDDGEEWVERIIEMTRVTKVVKGGKIMGFRCVAIVGNQNGLVGVGCQAGREVAVAVKRTLQDAKRNVVRVPIVGAGTVPHRSEAKYHAARCVVLPASDGTGCIAGGAVRSVLELAGVKNCLAKRLGSRSALNSARATVRALQQMQSLYEVSRVRGIPLEQLLLPQ